MKSPALRLWGLYLFFVLIACATAQNSADKVVKIEIKHVGPASVSDELIRSNIRVKIGDRYQRAATDDDIASLYGTGLFYNIRVARDVTPEGVVLTYLVQGKPRLTEITFKGNKRFSESKLRKKLSSKIGEPLDERKLFTDSQEIQKMYQKSGHPRTVVKPISNVIEESGRATATFEISESPKIKIIRVEYVNAKAFSQRKLRKVIKTRKHWMFSWITGSGYLKDEQFEDDQDKLREHYRDQGYLDFEIKEVQFHHPSPRKMVIRFIVYEGSQYKVGSIKFTGNKIFTLSEITNGVRHAASLKPGKHKSGPNGLPMDVGDVFSQKGLTRDIEAVEDFYGAKGYIDVTTSSRNLNVIRIPNIETGTMDLEFHIDEGQKSYIEKIEIRGNTKTKDKVIRRELAVSPGEVFDMVRVKVSRQRLEGLQYFEKVDTRQEAIEPPIAGHKNLVVGVDEKSTGNLTMGAGFSSVDSIVGFAEVYQGNFDLFHPPTFTGGGQKFRLRVQIGTERQDYLVSFIEPWFLGRKLAFGVDLYHREWNFQSLDNLYNETRTGARFSFTRALWSDFLIGTLSYTVEDVGIFFNDNATRARIVEVPGEGNNPPTYVTVPGNTPEALFEQAGHSLLSKAGASIAYDTRGGGLLPNRGQRTELFGQFVGGPLGGDKKFYTLELKSAWYFRGFLPSHIIEIAARTGVADSLESEDVPFYERFYLGGLYSLRGFKYRSVSPREGDIREPIGGDTYWFGSAEYSIPIIERLRFAVFYDVGNVAAKSYDYTDLSHFNDNWGIGLRLNLPIGPLRLDYGIPINHDEFNGGSGRFQFGVGYTREF
jgi:outer membrane protein insertion porin family